MAEDHSILIIGVERVNTIAGHPSEARWLISQSKAPAEVMDCVISVVASSRLVHIIDQLHFALFVNSM